MKISKQLLLEKLTASRVDNDAALENEETSDEVYAQEEAIRDTYDLIEKMIKELEEEEESPKHIFDPITAGGVKEQLKGYSDDAKIIAIIWGESDVRGMNKDDKGNSELDEEFEGTPLTDEQVDKVLKSLTHNHDACYGISWDTIEDTINYVKED